MGNTGSSVDVVRTGLDEDQGKEELQRTANKGRSNTSSTKYSELRAGLPHTTVHTAS
jgi:hypothetical protein